jgi:hypothetical protein
MTEDKKLEEKVAMYAALGKDNKNVDVAALMVSAMEQARRDEIDGKKKKRAYMVSILLPPFGLYYVARYYFSDKDDGKRVALTCLILTIFALAIGWMIGGAMFGNTPTGSLEQMKAVNIEDMKSLLQ